MRDNKTDGAVYRRIADDSGLSVLEVRKAVLSFFDSIVLESKKLPFDNPRKIYTRSAFKEFNTVHCIPYIGRFGTSHTRYLKWRANEAQKENMVPRADFRMGLSKGEIEEIAKKALRGEKIEKRNKRNTPFKRVWLVGENGKKQARQVIPKENE